MSARERLRRSSAPHRAAGRVAVIAAAGVGLLAASLVSPVAAVAAPTATVAGLVTGPSGERLGGVEVVVQGVDAPAVTTTSTGHYSATGLPPGRQAYLCAVPPLDYRGGTSRTGYVSTCSPQTLAAGRTRVDLQLPVGAAAAGSVTDDRTGRPVTQAAIRTLNHEIGNLPTVTSTANGSWSVRGLEPAPGYEFTASAGPTTDAPFGYHDTYDDPLGPIDLAAGERHGGLKFRLAPATEIVGTLTGPAALTAFTVETATGDFYGTGRQFVVHPKAIYGAGQADHSLCVSWGYSDADPRGVAIQCVDLSYSPFEASHVSLKMAVGGGVRGTVTGTTTVSRVWVDWNGRQLEGRRVGHGTSYVLGSLPTGTYVVHATDGSGRTGQSAPVHVVQGSVVSGVDIAVS